jgi:hypothetical protein
MSAHDVVVHANNYGTDPVLMDTLKIGNSMTIQVSGVTTIEKVPVAGSYRIYGVNGKNVATGILTDTLVINYNKATLQYDFVMTVTFVLDANNFDVAMKWTEWTLDVFQEKSGSDEGMCVEFSSIEYVNYLQTKQDPPFVDLCVDRGDGTFENQTIAITTALDTLHVTSPPGCVEKCNLKWNWCPRKLYHSTLMVIQVLLLASLSDLFNLQNLSLSLSLSLSPSSRRSWMQDLHNGCCLG